MLADDISTGRCARILSTCDLALLNSVHNITIVGQLSPLSLTGK